MQKRYWSNLHFPENQLWSHTHNVRNITPCAHWSMYFVLYWTMLPHIPRVYLTRHRWSPTKVNILQGFHWYRLWHPWFLYEENTDIGVSRYISIHTRICIWIYLKIYGMPNIPIPNWRGKLTINQRMVCTCFKQTHVSCCLYIHLCDYPILNPNLLCIHVYFMYVCMYVCMHSCMHACMHVYIYIYPILHIGQLVYHLSSCACWLSRELIPA